MTDKEKVVVIQFENMREKAEKYDKLKKALYNTRSEIIEHRCKTQTIDPYDLVGDCLDIINKHILEIEE